MDPFAPVRSRDGHPLITRWPIFLAVALLVTMEGSALSQMQKRSGNCKHGKSYGKQTADCEDLSLKTVPTNLRTDIQALVLTFNRIRELNNDSFSRYTSLELLYLDDNSIAFVDDGVFDPLQNLEVLVLSINSLHQIPSSVLRLPNLRKLDISDNPLDETALSRSLAHLPEENNIRDLSLARIRLRSLPPLDRLLRLERLNVSGNQLGAGSVRAAQLAPLCSLRVLVLGERKALGPCDCAVMNDWGSREGSKLHIEPPSAAECNLEGSDLAQCLNSTMAWTTRDMRAQCKSILAAQAETARVRCLLTWSAAGVGGGVLLIIVCCLCICWRRRRARRKARRRAALGADTARLTALSAPTPNAPFGGDSHGDLLQAKEKIRRED